MAEECAEVIQAITKIQRHGFESHHPDNEGGRSNRYHLLQEIGDVSAIMTMLLKGGDLPHPPTDEMIYAKLERLKKYTHHQ